ncbi:MAG: patatin-like phospholipase family protein [Rhizobiales bacterium]|nr:patatin-like phospholipase family protein [Hyphomicrobiales bacterium]
MGFADGSKGVNLALQGGGAHGAFTWGVVDQLLADGRIAVDGISGASAGAVNAVMLADGLARGGPDEARQRLADFWRAASFGGSLPELQREAIERLFAFVPRQSSPVPWFNALSRYWSPYDLNPLNINPLKNLIERFVDFAQVRGDTRRELFISATNVQSGKQRVFSRSEMSAEAVMASACLPLLFHAVEIDGVPYWDGGYSGNPPVLPFLRATTTEDVLIVQINPIERDGAPTSARDIMTRLQELTFNAPLLAELRALELAERLITEGDLPRGTAPGQYRRIRLHRIVMDAEAFNDRGKLNNDYEYFDNLRQLGQSAAQRFLGEHFDDIGRHSTMDLQAEAAPEWGNRRSALTKTAVPG